MQSSHKNDSLYVVSIARHAGIFINSIDVSGVEKGMGFALICIMYCLVDDGWE